ncbi:MAG: hypothetical protein Q7T55_10970, partial [Solirubrobacteraceae bacterium]|nr:hypothetical protein [Solirubrobacteraceae bacterium]
DVTLTPTARNLLATVVVVGLLIAAVGAAVFSAYTSVAGNEDNRFTAGTIKLTDNDAGNALFEVNGFTPGDSFIRCIRVGYESTGGVRSDVKLYGASGGDGLADYLDVRVRRGTMPAVGTSGDCTGFTPDATDYNGDGDGVIVDSALSIFPADYASGIADPVAEWDDGDAAVYEITLTVQNDNAAQGLSATQDFSFEARNL